jgi:hypothetical protein
MEMSLRQAGSARRDGPAIKKKTIANIPELSRSFNRCKIMNKLAINLVESQSVLDLIAEAAFSVRAKFHR